MQVKEERLNSFERQVDRVIDQLLYSRDPAETSSFFPSHIHIEPTNACNLRCIHCHHHSGSRRSGKFTRKLGIMDMELYEAVISQLAPFNCSITLNCQGEPTLHRNIVQMILLAKSKGLHVSLLTNGTRLDGLLTEKILASGLDRIVFSFDAVEKELYESIRVNGNFESTLANINNFLDRNHESGHPVFVCMSIVVQDKTRDHLQAYREFFEKRPIDTIFESAILNLSGNTGTSDTFTIPASTELNGIPICRIPWENMVINWDGLVSVCPLDFDGKWIAGDARTTPLVEIWNSEPYRQFRKAHIGRHYDVIEQNGTLCSACSCLWDPEYDLRNYGEFIKRLLVRTARQLF